ncbi:hypothetical protein KIH74_27110 [Kineosporia sp. J2-2]|uniref:Integral membrane protein n=1 Tax=Kineosporia corallincola TaxID=2835133 RepID=A0ABS5TP89_9ACTN|nr:hypothetical protein [Kineosporia corallincola]MBT0772643.1 hypothetical protein [Kineosporia corallincola]
MGLILRTWVIAGALYVALSVLSALLTGGGDRPAWLATLISLVVYGLVTGIPGWLYRRAREQPPLGAYLLAVVPVPLVLLVLSVLLWTSRDVSGGTVTGRVLEWLGVLVVVTGLVRFLPVRREPAPRVYG